MNGSVIERVVDGLDTATGAEIFVNITVERGGVGSDGFPVDLAAELLVNETVSVGGHTLMRVTTTVEASASGGSKVTYEVSFKARDAFFGRSVRAIHTVFQRLPAPVVATMGRATQATGSYISQLGRQGTLAMGELCEQVLASAPGVAGSAALTASQALVSTELDQSGHRHVQQQTLEK